MNRSCVVNQKPCGYVKLTHPKEGAEQLMFGTNGQSNLVGFYISIMLAIILVLDVVWPTIDSTINGSDNSAYDNLTSTAKTLINLFGLILALGLLIMMLRPIM